jgi:hypothetical protein
MALPDLITRALNEPAPLRRLCRAAIREMKIGGYRFRYQVGALRRPNYAHLVYNAAVLAARLGEPRVSILEFGVAGGSGLVMLEYHAEEVEKIVPVKIEVYGFDTGEGLPDPKDYRDLPYVWKPGFFKMDVPALKARLRRSQLVLGNVSDTVPTFFDQYDPAPIGAVCHDMDFYSSTAVALQIFDGDEKRMLPRILCYFDDTIGDQEALYGDWTGQRLAIAEFNESHTNSKISPAFYLRAMPLSPVWHHQIWTAHLFSHSKYNQFISSEDQQLPL